MITIFKRITVFTTPMTKTNALRSVCRIPIYRASSLRQVCGLNETRLFVSLLKTSPAYRSCLANFKQCCATPSSRLV